MSALAAGLGFAKFLQDFIQSWILLTVATALIFLSIVAFLLAAWRYSHLHIRLNKLDIDATPPWMVRLMSFMLIGCSLLVLFGLYVGL